MNINARSVLNKTDKLEAVILGHNPHVVVITETWLHDEIDDTDVFPSDYRAFRRDRHTRGGGVAVLVRQDITAVLLRQTANLETLSLKILCRNTSFLLFAVYRAPDSPPQFLQDLHEHMASFVHNKIFLIGDFNLPGIDWIRGTYSADVSVNNEHLRDIILMHNLQQVVTEPTRISAASASILDLIFISQTFQEFSVSVEQGISDHELVAFSCTIDLPKSTSCKTVSVKDYSRANDVSVLDYLDDSLSAFGGHDAAKLWDEFKNICMHCIDNFIPSRTKKTSKPTPWMTREIVHAKRKVKRLRRRGISRDEIVPCQAKLNEAVRAAKLRYFQFTLPNFIRTAPSKFWSFLSKKSKPVDHIMHEGNPVVAKQEIAVHFNAYFNSIFSNSPVPRCLNHTLVKDDFSFVSLPGVFSMLLNIKTKSSPGPDNLPNVFLHRYAEMLSRFLVIIFRASLSSAVLPNDWLSARVIPILKKGDPSLVQNYRPISLTSSCCKLLEHIIANEITRFLDDRAILTPMQHGFRKGLSTVTQLTTVIHSLASVVDKSGQTDVIFLDFRKAFDLVSHAKLIEKLVHLDVPSYLVNWISAYLTNRRQFVAIDNCCSSDLAVTSGVPQGSVLGPLLFNIYINDIVDSITEPVQIKLFADDCLLFNEITCQQDQITLNSNLQKILTWCERWDMQLNIDKTVFMKITKKINKLSFTYNLASMPLTEVDEYKYLGVIITNNLSWNSHISHLCDSAFKKLCYLRHKLKHAPPETRLTAYTSLVRPKLEYAAIVWDPYTKTNIDALERIQRKAVRFIFSKYRTSDSPSDLMAQHNIQSLQLRRKIHRLKFLFLLYNNKLSLSPEPYIKPLTARRTRHRHSATLTPYNTRTNIFKYSFFPRTVADWNSLPLSTLSNTDSIASISS